MQKRVTISRLLRLAEFLETKVPRKHFSMTLINDGALGLGTGHCGSAGCAIGWMPVVPSFKRRGVRYDKDGAVCFGPRADALKVDASFAAAEKFLGLSDSQSFDLFADYSDGKSRAKETPKQVAKRIRKFVAELRAA